MVIVAFLLARNGEQPRCPSTEEWIKKMWYIYMMEYDLAVKNNMDTSRKYHAE